MSNTHAENQRFSCDFKTGESACSYYSTTKSNLRAHKKRVHEKTIDAIPPKHACGLCGYRTSSEFSLGRHSEKCNRSLNQNPIDRTCNICSKKILTKLYKLHNRIKCDTPIRAASCVVCKKTFVNKWNMERHTQKDHGLTEKGNVIENSAGIAIFTTEALVKEKVSETRAKRLLHQCEKCQYSTVQKAHLRRHIQNKHDGRTKPKMRGKTGPISDRTKRQGGRFQWQ